MKLKHILRFILSAGMAVSFVSLAMAQAASTELMAEFSNTAMLDVESHSVFQVTVPTTLPLQISSDGSVTTADDIYITNYSNGAVIVSDIAIIGKNGWETVATSKKLSIMPMDVQEFSLIINGETTTGADTITFDSSNWPAIAAANDSDTDRLRLEYSASIVPQSQPVIEEIADVVFTIRWNETGEDQTDGQAFESDKEAAIAYSVIDQADSSSSNSMYAENYSANTTDTQQIITVDNTLTINANSEVLVVENVDP